jgi:hypothetical protein
MNLSSIAGLILIVLGGLSLYFGGVPYKRHDEILRIGETRITTESKDMYEIPPVVGGAVMAAGAVLLVIGLRRKD